MLRVSFRVPVLNFTASFYNRKIKKSILFSCEEAVFSRSTGDFNWVGEKSGNGFDFLRFESKNLSTDYVFVFDI